jgi:sensor histidine kinase regulating citrate/malate metabolism
MTVLTLKAKHDHLQKVATTRDYVKAISEFVWNALDADAKRTSVEFTRNALGGLEGIIIRDNGTGISEERAHHDFESLGDSWKLTTARTPVLGRAIRCAFVEFRHPYRDDDRPVLALSRGVS